MIHDCCNLNCTTYEPDGKIIKTMTGIIDDYSKIGSTCVLARFVLGVLIARDMTRRRKQNIYPVSTPLKSRA